LASRVYGLPSKIASTVGSKIENVGFDSETKSLTPVVDNPSLSSVLINQNASSDLSLKTKMLDDIVKATELYYKNPSPTLFSGVKYDPNVLSYADLKEVIVNRQWPLDPSTPYRFSVDYLYDYVVYELTSECLHNTVQDVSKEICI
jgi:hypothetical protein